MVSWINCSSSEGVSLLQFYRQMGKHPSEETNFQYLKAHTQRNHKMSLKAMWEWELKDRLLGYLGEKLNQASWHQNSSVFPRVKTMLHKC